MKKLLKLVVIAGVLMSVSTVASARNTKYLLPLSTAMSNATSKGVLNGSVKFYFANEYHPRVLKNLGTFVANPKSNAFGKTDGTACDRAFQSAVKSLQARAIALGGNAVINVVSYYDKNVMASNSVYECHAGAMVAGITLRGEVVRLAK